MIGLFKCISSSHPCHKRILVSYSPMYWVLAEVQCHRGEGQDYFALISTTDFTMPTHILYRDIWNINFGSWTCNDSKYYTLSDGFDSNIAKINIVKRKICKLEIEFVLISNANNKYFYDIFHPLHDDHQNIQDL